MSEPGTSTAGNIRYEAFSHEDQIAIIQDLVQDDLSEPYTLFTFRYFIHEFPELCIFAYDSARPVGVIICRLDRRKTGILRGYIGMLTVDKSYRHKGIATQLAHRAIEAMKQLDAQEIVLETEVDNAAALAFYSRLNFIRYKRMHAFYLNRKDAFRLLLPLERPDPPEPAEAQTFLSVDGS